MSVKTNNDKSEIFTWRGIDISVNGDECSSSEKISLDVQCGKNVCLNDYVNTTGSLTVYGGSSLAYNINVCGKNVCFSNYVDTTGSLTVDGSVGLEKIINVGGNRGNTTGSLTVYGGSSLEKIIYVGGIIYDDDCHIIKK